MKTPAPDPSSVPAPVVNFELHGDTEMETINAD